MNQFKVEVFVDFSNGEFTGYMYERDENGAWGESLDFHVQTDYVWEEVPFLDNKSAYQCLHAMRKAVVDEVKWRKITPDIKDRHLDEGLVFSEEVPFYG